MWPRISGATILDGSAKIHHRLATTPAGSMTTVDVPPGRTVVSTVEFPGLSGSRSVIVRHADHVSPVGWRALYAVSPPPSHNSANGVPSVPKRGYVYTAALVDVVSPEARHGF